MRTIYLLSFFLISTTIYGQRPIALHNLATGRVQVETATVFDNKSYPTFENGTAIPLSERTLQALNVGSTFHRPRFAGNLAFVGGIYTEKGRVSSGENLDDISYCFINPHGSERPPVREQDLYDRMTCALKNIEGAEFFEREKMKSSYRTKLELRCGEWDFLEITCHKPSNGEAREMTLGEFEKTLFRHFRFGNLVLETPLVQTGNNGYTLESPITPEQVIAGTIKFKFNDTTGMSFVPFSVGEDKGYKHYFQNGVSSSQSPDRLKGDMMIAIETPNSVELSATPNSTDINDMSISSVEVGYTKRSLGKNEAFRKSHLLVRGKKTIKGVESNVSVYWDDPENSHITYEGMWKIPGRKIINNWSEPALSK